MKIFNIKKIGKFLLLLAVIFSFHSVFAQENNIPKDLLPLAQELGCQTKEECVKAFDSDFEKGLNLAEKYKVYSKEQSEIAKSYKDEVISKLSGITEENFEEEIIKIAKGILSRPKTAKSLQLDKDAVSAAETIVKEVKDAGTNIEVCTRPADTLSREELISCLEASKKLAKKGNIAEKYLPKGIIEKSEMAGMTADLDEALARGEYSELGKTAEEVGQKCLRPGSESLKSCDVIAEKYFGPEGVKELTAIRAQTKQTGDFYLKGLENMELITADGRKIAGKTAIKESCEKAFQTKDIKLARACGEFAVKNGFADKQDVEESLKFFESVADKNINFDQCRINPDSCQKFIPEEYKKEFAGQKKIYEIMKAEAGFDSLRCERSQIEFEMGKRCFEAAKKALPKLKEIAGEFPEARRMVLEIESGIKREEEQSQRQKEFSTVFQNQGGPGGCASEKECFAYCNDSAHGAECISFGAKYDFFERGEVAERYQKYNAALNFRSDDIGYRPAIPQATPYQGGPDFRGGAQGPSPECFAAIQSGDFARAKEICNVQTNPYQYQQQIPYQVYPDDRYRSDRPCPAVAVAQCPEGQYREQKFTDNCPVYGQCLPIPNYQRPSSAPAKIICPFIPEYNCQSGYQKIYKTTPDGCGISECAPFSNSSYPSSDEKEKCYRGGGFWTGNYCDYQSRSSSSYSSYGYAGSCPSGLTNLLGAGCHQMYTDSSGISIYCNSEMNKSAKQGDTVAQNGCQSSGNYSSYPSPTGQREQLWNSYGLRSWIRTDADTARIERLKQSCVNVSSSSWDIWMPGAGNYSSPDFGMPDEAKCRAWTPGSQSSYSYSSYPANNYSSCANEMVSLLGSGCHFMYNDSSNTAVYCNGEMTKSAKLGNTVAQNGCQSGGNYSSYGSYSSYAGDANSCPGFAYSRWDSANRRYCQLNNERKCDYNYPSYLTNGTNYKVENCPASDSSTGNWSSYSYSSYNYGGSNSSYASPSGCSSEFTNLLGSGCHYMSTAYFNGDMTQYVNPGTTAVKSCSSEYISGCSSGYNSSPGSAGSYSSYSYSSYDPSTACAQSGGIWNGSSCQSNTSSYGGTSSSYSIDPSVACSQAGGSWNGTSCIMPSAASSAAAYSSASADPSTACAQAGGSWDGSTCVMPPTSLNNKSGSLLASIGEALERILRIFSR